MADYMDDLSSLPLEDGPPSSSTGSGARLDDTADNGIRPEGMEVRHEDDDEGGEGDERPDDEDDEDREQDEDVTSNTNRIPGAGNGSGNGPEEEGEGEGDEEDEDDDDDEENDDDDDDDEQDENDRPRKKVRSPRNPCQFVQCTTHIIIHSKQKAKASNGALTQSCSILCYSTFAETSLSRQQVRRYRSRSRRG